MISHVDVLNHFGCVVGSSATWGILVLIFNRGVSVADQVAMHTRLGSGSRRFGAPGVVIFLRFPVPFLD